MFQSTRPARGATAANYTLAYSWAVSIHAPRAGRDLDAFKLDDMDLGVSIHAPRAGRDDDSRDAFLNLLVSIHAPRAGRDAFLIMRCA